MNAATSGPIDAGGLASSAWPFTVPLDIHSEDFLRLKRLLHRPGHFQLVIAQFNAPRYRDAIIAAAIPTETEETAKPALWTLPDQPDLDALQAGLAERSTHAAGLHLVGLDRWLTLSPGPVLQGLNYRREGIAAVARLPIVLWLAPEQVRPFAEQAPDLWAWRAAVLDFAVELNDWLSIEWEPLREGHYVNKERARIRLAKIEAYLRDASAIRTTPDLELEAAGLHNLLADEIAARQRAEGALSNYLKMGNSQGAASAWGLIADILEKRENPDEALRIRIEEQLPTVARLGDRRQEAIVRNRIGTSLLERGELDQAHGYFMRSLTICRETGDHEGEGATLNNLSQIHEARGELDEALTLLSRSLVIGKEIGNRWGEARTLSNLAQIHKSRGDLEQALSLLERALAIQQEIEDRAGEVTTIHRLAQIHNTRGEFDHALELYGRSLAIQQEIGDRAGESVTLSNISTIHLARGGMDEALTLLKRSLAICEESRYLPGSFPILFNLGYVQWQTGERQAALKNWIAAYQLAQSIGLSKELEYLERLASQIGLPEGLAGWESLAHQLETTGRVELPLSPKSSSLG